MTNLWPFRNLSRNHRIRPFLTSFRHLLIPYTLINGQYPSLGPPRFGSSKPVRIDFGRKFVKFSDFCVFSCFSVLDSSLFFYEKCRFRDLAIPYGRFSFHETPFWTLFGGSFTHYIGIALGFTKWPQIIVCVFGDHKIHKITIFQKFVDPRFLVAGCQMRTRCLHRYPWVYIGFTLLCTHWIHLFEHHEIKNQCSTWIVRETGIRRWRNQDQFSSDDRFCEITSNRFAAKLIFGVPFMTLCLSPHH